MGVIEKINAALTKMGVDLQVAKVALAASGDTQTSGSTSGSTSGVTVTSAAAGVVVSEIIPQTIKISYSAIGAPVIQTNEDGKEENVTDGEYILTTNKKIKIQDGKLVSEEEVEEIEEEEMSGMTEMSIENLEVALAEVEAELAKTDKSPEDETALGCKKKKILAEIEAKKESKIKFDAAVLEMATNLERQRIADLIPMDKNGNYTIEISISDGVITWGSLYSNTYQNLLMEREEELGKEVDKLTQAFETRLAEEKTRYEGIIEALKTGETKSSTPVASDVKLSKSDLIKLDIQAKINNK